MGALYGLAHRRSRDQPPADPAHKHHADRSTGINTHTRNRFTALFRDHPGEPVPED